MQPGARKTDWVSLALFAVSAISSGSSLLTALTAGAAGLLGLIAGAGSQFDPYALLSLSAGMLLIALAGVPALLLSFLRLSGRPLPGWPARRWPLGLLAAGLPLLFAAAVLAGDLSTRAPAGAIIFPAAVMLAVLLPLAFFLLAGSRRLGWPSPYRTAGSLVVVLGGVMPLSFGIEMILLVLILLAAVLGLAARPELLEQLSSQLSTVQNDPASAESFIQGLLLQPGVIPGVLLYTSLLVPLIEELLKPLAVWLLAWRRLDPRQGFILGMLSGAAFALIEAVSALSMAASSGWWSLAVSRAGTSLLHITTSGLMGWAIARAFSTRKILPLAGVYALAVGIHGLWNASAIFEGLKPLLPMQWKLNGVLAAPMLIILVLIMLLILLGTNRRLARQPIEG